MRLPAFGCMLLCSALPLAAQQLTVYTTDYPPLSMVGQSGNISGIGIELLRQAAQKSGITLDIRGDLAWKRAQQSAKQTRNVCLYPFTRAEVREYQFRWVSLVIPSEHGLYALPDGPRPQQIGEVAKLRTVVMLGTTAEGRLRDQGLPYSTTITPADSLRMLRHRAVDLWAVHDIVARYYAVQLAIPIRRTMGLGRADNWLACNLAVPMEQVTRLDKAITQLRANGEDERITQRYLQRQTP